MLVLNDSVRDVRTSVMKILIPRVSGVSLTTLCAALFFGSCATAPPPNPRHVDADDYLSNVSASTYVGESEDHAFLLRGDGYVIYADTEDLPSAEQAKVRAAGKTYTGPGSNIRSH